MGAWLRRIRGRGPNGGCCVNLSDWLHPPTLAAAWNAQQRVAPVFAGHNAEIQRIQSQLSVGGRVATWQEAEAEYGRRYAAEATVEGQLAGFDC